MYYLIGCALFVFGLLFFGIGIEEKMQELKNKFEVIKNSTVHTEDKFKESLKKINARIYPGGNDQPLITVCQAEKLLNKDTFKNGDRVEITEYINNLPTKGLRGTLDFFASKYFYVKLDKPLDVGHEEIGVKLSQIKKIEKEELNERIEKIEKKVFKNKK